VRLKQRDLERHLIVHGCVLARCSILFHLLVAGG
jgi:hypothetical protein